MVYLRPTADEIDSWSVLGNTGLSWDSLLPYFKKSEHFQLPTDPRPRAIAEASHESSVHGFIGPVKLGWGNDLAPGAFGQALNTTWQSLGFSWNVDPNSGNNTGLGLFPIEKDTVLQIRQDSARSYYLPVIGRPNLHAFTNTTALNIDLDSGKSHHGPKSAVVAKGVNVILPSGKKQLLRSKQEVILSAGTYRTPGLLERSGIGNPSCVFSPVITSFDTSSKQVTDYTLLHSILRNLSITPKVPLPGVGAHLQDQWLINAVYNANFTPTSFVASYNAKPLSASVTAAELFGSDLDTVAAQLYADIPAYARTLSEASNGAISVQAQEQILLTRASLFFDKKVAIGAFMFGIFGGNCWVTLPLSTGNVHVSLALSLPLLPFPLTPPRTKTDAVCDSHPPILPSPSSTPTSSNSPGISWSNNVSFPSSAVSWLPPSLPPPYTPTPSSYLLATLSSLQTPLCPKPLQSSKLSWHRCGTQWAQQG